MNLKELRHREVCFLNLGKSQYKEYGIALKEIIEMCENYSGPKLSEDFLISNMAYKYADNQKQMHDLTKNENHLFRMKAAAELYKKEQVDPEQIHEILNKNKKQYKFHEANELLKKEPFYKNINPQTVIDVLQRIKVKRANAVHKNDS